MKMRNFTAENRPSHAYIISSNTETKIQEAYKKLASAMLCENVGEVPCGYCKHCKKIQRDLHPDVIFMDSELNDKGVSKKDVSVRQMKIMVHDTYVKANEARGKVYIIRDNLSVLSQNVLLMSLEEPPKGVHFIICVENHMKLLQTVRSRCILIRLQDELEDSVFSSKAREFLAALEKDKRADFLALCVSFEKLSVQELGEFINCLRQAITEKLRLGNTKIDLENYVRLDELLCQMLLYLKVNTSVKHLCGLLSTFHVEKQ